MGRKEGEKDVWGLFLGKGTLRDDGGGCLVGWNSVGCSISGDREVW